MRDFEMNIRNLLFPYSLNLKPSRAVYGSRAIQAQAIVTLWKTMIVLWMPSRVLCGHHLLRARRLRCCRKERYDWLGSLRWEAVNLARIRAIFQKWEQGGFYHDRTAKLYSVQIYTVQNNRERIGLTVREWLVPESFGNKVHLRPFH